MVRIWGKPELLTNFSAEYRPFCGRKPQLNFKKYVIFVIFIQNWANFGKFFFQNEIFVEIGPQNTKNDFKRLLWILKMIFMHFMIIFDTLKIWVFENFLVSNRDREPEMSQHDCKAEKNFDFLIIFFITKNKIDLLDIVQARSQPP